MHRPADLQADQLRPNNARIPENSASCCNNLHALQVWVGAFEAALQAAETDAQHDGSAANTRGSSGGGNARGVLERALKTLPKHKHIKAITRCACCVHACQLAAGSTVTRHIASRVHVGVCYSVT